MNTIKKSVSLALCMFAATAQAQKLDPIPYVSNLYLTILGTSTPHENCFVDTSAVIELGDLSEVGWTKYTNDVRVVCNHAYVFSALFNESPSSQPDGAFYSDDYVDVYIGVEDAQHDAFQAGYPDSASNPSECIKGAGAGEYSQTATVNDGLDVIYTVSGPTSAHYSTNYNSCFTSIVPHSHTTYGLPLVTHVNVKKLPDSGVDKDYRFSMPVTLIVEAR